MEKHKASDGLFHWHHAFFQQILDHQQQSIFYS